MGWSHQHRLPWVCPLSNIVGQGIVPWAYKVASYPIPPISVLGGAGWSHGFKWMVTMPQNTFCTSWSWEETQVLA